MARQTPTFYVFHGEDDYTIRAEVHKLRDKMGDDLNTSEFDGTQVSVGEVLAAAQSMPFLSDKRLILVEGMLSSLSGKSKKAKEQMTQLVEALPKLPEFTRLVFIETQKLSAKHPALKAVKENPNGYAKEFDVPRNPATWLRRKAEEYGVTLEPKALSALVNIIDNDLRRADNELVKLAAYVGEGQTITEQDVATLTSYVPEGNIFEMTDALGLRDTRTAQNVLHQLMRDSDAQSLMGMIIRQFRLLIQAREVLDSGGRTGDIASAIGVHPFVGKKLAEQVRHFHSIEELEAIFRHLLEIDVAIKTGRIDDSGVGLDLFIARLSVPAE